MHYEARRPRPRPAQKAAATLRPADAGRTLQLYDEHKDTIQRLARGCSPTIESVTQHRANHGRPGRPHCGITTATTPDKTRPAP